MKNILDYLYAHKTFSKDEAKEVLENITLGKYNAAQIASILTVFIMRNITLEELIGFLIPQLLYGHHYNQFQMLYYHQDSLIRLNCYRTDSAK